MWMTTKARIQMLVEEVAQLQKERSVRELDALEVRTKFLNLCKRLEMRLARMERSPQDDPGSNNAEEVESPLALRERLRGR